MKTKNKQILKSLITVFLCLFAFYPSFSQQIVVNEVSQGASGAKEYVELLVVGTPTCNAIPCMDLRNYIVDDNNGTFASGAGTGIAAGCIRFKNDPFWSCIPIGTIILIYNDADQNANIPAQDVSMSDGNCRLVIPISNCTLLEKQTTQPSTSTSTYPIIGFAACGNWNHVGMANSDDSFQTLTPSGTLIHAVSWGNNTSSTIIYFAGSAGGKVAVMTNAADNNPANQANWVMVGVAGNETPGSPNNAANSAWISSMNNSCMPLLPLTLTVSASNASCTCNGSASVTASGAIGPYTYTWAPSGGNASTASGLCSGTYTVSVGSSNGCVQTATVHIGNTASFTIGVTTGSVACHGAATGSATLNPSGGTIPYSYTWSPTGGNSNTATNLPAGNYNITIADASGCSGTTTLSIAEPPVLTSAITSNSVSCFGNSTGSATVVASGGVALYTYTWSPSGGNTSVASSLAAGNYTVNILDNNQCSTTATVSIAQPPALTLTVVSASVSCFGGATGSATATVSGGVLPYTYTWSPSGGNSVSASGLNAGTYSVAVQDANQCPIQATAVITQPADLILALTTSSATCGNSNGSSTVTASGGVSPYNYTWTPVGGNASMASSLAPGSYTALVMDANGCSKTAVTSVLTAGALTTTASGTDISCFGFANGSATVTASGATSPYNYTWTPGNMNTAQVSGLSAGVYTVSVSDQNNCQSTSTVQIIEPPVISTTLSASNVSCFGASNGSATITASGGASALTYSWSQGGLTTQSISSLSVGIYTVTTRDLNNCTNVSTVTVSGPAALTLTVSSTDEVCTQANGSATVTATGGNGSYTYTWTPSNQHTAVATALSASVYTVHVSDINSCSSSATVSIASVGNLTTTVASASVTCFGANTGSASISTAGGTGNYTYNWLPAGTAANTASVAASLTSGQYSVTVTDVNGCNSTQTLTIQQPSPLNASASGVQICKGQQANVTTIVGGGTAPYTYSWSPTGGSNANLAVSPTVTTTYTLQVSDSKSCTASPVVVTVQVSPSLSLTVSGPSVTCAGTTASLTAHASGGNGNYQYSWMPGNLSGASVNPVINSNVQYTVTVSDNCTTQPAQATISVTALPAPLIHIANTNAKACPPLCVSFFDSTLIQSGIVTSWQWQFSNGDVSAQSTPYVCFMQSGNYTGTLTVQTSNGCPVQPAVISGIDIYPVPVADFVSDTYETTFTNPIFQLSNTSPGSNQVSWLADGYSYSGDNITLNLGNEGIYPVKLVAVNNFGCRDSVTKNLVVKSDFTLYAPNAFTPNGDIFNAVFMPVGMGWKEETFTLYIFDRWGNVLYKTTDTHKGWDGTKQGVVVEQDVYVWKVELDDIFNKHHSVTGSVSVIR
ncbi:MAG: T9SS type B sorting domain-containing protein [Bacteroidetes bacterium]|nr:T9SS type B sorting domain-containing protein [Bacteroidota bacterium]